MKSAQLKISWNFATELKHIQVEINRTSGIYMQNLLFDFRVHFDTFNKFFVFVFMAQVHIKTASRKTMTKQFDLVIEINKRRKNERSSCGSNLPEYKT